jgi:hypothetical protein
MHLQTAVTLNGEALAIGTHKELQAGFTIDILAQTNDTLTGASEVAILETPKIRLTVWAPLAASISEDPSENQERTCCHSSPSIQPVCSSALRVEELRTCTREQCTVCHISACMQETPGLDWNLAVMHASEVAEMHGVVGQTWADSKGNNGGMMHIHCHFNNVLGVMETGELNQVR